VFCCNMAQWCHWIIEGSYFGEHNLFYGFTEFVVKPKKNSYMFSLNSDSYAAVCCNDIYWNSSLIR
jgi:hypothetical protein